MTFHAVNTSGVVCANVTIAAFIAGFGHAFKFGIADLILGTCFRRAAFRIGCFGEIGAKLIGAETGFAFFAIRAAFAFFGIAGRTNGAFFRRFIAVSRFASRILCAIRAIGGFSRTNAFGGSGVDFAVSGFAIAVLFAFFTVVGTFGGNIAFICRRIAQIVAAIRFASDDIGQTVADFLAGQVKLRCNCIGVDGIVDIAHRLCFVFLGAFFEATFSIAIDCADFVIGTFFDAIGGFA